MALDKTWVRMILLTGAVESLMISVLLVHTVYPRIWSYITNHILIGGRLVAATNCGGGGGEFCDDGFGFGFCNNACSAIAWAASWVFMFGVFVVFGGNVGFVIVGDNGVTGGVIRGGGGLYCCCCSCCSCFFFFDKE